MRAVLRYLSILAILMISSSGFARIHIRVGAYEFPPYFDVNKSKPEGLTVETVRILNSMQRDYKFEIQSLPPKQRYSHFAKKRVDMFLFEDPAWEWAKIPYEFLPLDVEDGEVYVTKKGGLPPPQRFEDLKKMRIAIVKGFHYGFAGLDADERYLKKNFTVELSEDSEGSLHLVNIGVADVTVVAKSYIYDYIRKHKDFRDKIVISNNYDSIYKLGVIFNPKGPIGREKLEDLLHKLKKNPDFISLVDNRFTLTAKEK